MNVSGHALYRYMERVLKVDMESLKVQYMVDMGLPSLSYLRDAEFIGELRRRVDLRPFESRLVGSVIKTLTPEDRRRADTKIIRKNCGNFVAVLEGNNVVTVMLPKEEHKVAA